jgi:hypothetical protein
MMLFDFGQIHAAYPWVEIEAHGGEMVELAASEHLPGEWDEGGAKPDARLRRAPTALGNDAHMARYIARPGKQRFQRFEWAATKYLQVAVRDAPHGVKVRIGATATHYPAKDEGRFECSDPFLNKLWQVGKETLRQCMHDGWIDCPSRERRQWLGDATVENLAAHMAFGPSIAPLNRAFLRKVAESQRPDGLTQMFAPGDHGVNGLLIPDWTLQWILNLYDHYEITGDLEIVRELMPSVMKALDWFERQCGLSGLIEETPYWTFHDWAGFGRDGISTTTNALTIGALTAADEMARVCLGMRETVYAERADRMRAQLTKLAWDARRGVFVDSVDPKTLKQRPRVSQHANAAMLVWVETYFKEYDRVIDYVADPKRLRFTAAPPIAPTGEPVDEERDVVLANTYFSHFVTAALAKHWRMDAALDLMRARYRPMLDKGATTLWESFAPTASLCHGFSAGPVYHLSANLAGLKPIDYAGFALRFTPQFPDMDWAEAEVATKYGPVSARWERQGKDRVLATLSVPPNARIEIGGPLGWGYEGTEIAQAPVRRTEQIVFRRIV